MAYLGIVKIVSTLPSPLENNTLYLVRVGSGFDIYLTNSLGSPTAYPLNTAASNQNFNGGRPFDLLASQNISIFNGGSPNDLI